MAFSKKNILIIDDDEDILIQVKRILEGAGFDCLTAMSVKEGIKLALYNIPDLIITDLSMPEIDGFVFLKKKKLISQIKDIPVFVFSARSDKKDLHEAMALGALDYLLKPLKASWMLQKIRKCLMASKSETLIYKFQEPPSVSIQVKGEIDRINNQFMMFGSCLKLIKGKTVKIESLLLDENVKILGRVESISSTKNEEGEYLTKIKYMGLSEVNKNKLSEKIRKWR